MERVDLPGGVSLSRIVYGMWRIGDDPDTSTAHVRAKIDACLAQGITTIDQADIYGGYTAEGILGKALKENKGLRDQLEIVTKCDIVAPAGRYADARVKHYDTSPEHIARSIDNSLSDMGIDHIDLLLIHRPDPLMDHHATGRALDQAVASGRVRAVGVSNFRPWDWSLLQSAMDTPLATNQIEISLSAHEGMVNGDIAFLQERGIRPMAWSPLGGGALMDGSAVETLRGKMAEIAASNEVDEAAVAVAWLLAHPSGILPVMGTNTISRIETLSDALKVEMDRETWFDLYSAALGREVA
ncbi:MAG: oxidoreductase [Rhodobacteraceae bacterium]|nr:MAG: oxidoreductase [Paracoccaceae bacterium]